MRETVGIPRVSESDLMISDVFPASVESRRRSGGLPEELIEDIVWQTRVNWCLSYVREKGRNKTHKIKFI